MLSEEWLFLAAEARLTGLVLLPGCYNEQSLTEGEAQLSFALSAQLAFSFS